MDRDGLSKIRRTEMLSRLSALDRQIEEQAARAETYRLKGWSVATAEERLKQLRESRRLYRSALEHLLGPEFPAELRDAGAD